MLALFEKGDQACTSCMSTAMRKSLLSVIRVDMVGERNELGCLDFFVDMVGELHHRNSAPGQRKHHHLLHADTRTSRRERCLIQRSRHRLHLSCRSDLVRWHQLHHQRLLQPRVARATFPKTSVSRPPGDKHKQAAPTERWKSPPH